jgi:hypothetical protein
MLCLSPSELELFEGVEVHYWGVLQELPNRTICLSTFVLVHEPAID